MELGMSLDKAANKQLPGDLSDIVKTHAKIAIASAFVPVPGADMAAAATNIWTMYVRINNALDLPFSDNIIKSLASGIVTNLAGAAAGALVMGSALKFIPGLGSIGGAALMATTVYAITIASGIVYMKALSNLLQSGDTDSMTEAALKQATDDVLADKDDISEIIREGKDAYKKRDD